jgi:hypothetical protein
VLCPPAPPVPELLLDEDAAVAVEEVAVFPDDAAEDEDPPVDDVPVDDVLLDDVLVDDGLLDDGLGEVLPPLHAAMHARPKSAEADEGVSFTGAA